MKKLKLKKKVKVITTLLSFGMLLTVLPSMKLVAEDDITTDTSDVIAGPYIKYDSTEDYYSDEVYNDSDFTTLEANGGIAVATDGSTTNPVVNSDDNDSLTYDKKITVNKTINTVDGLDDVYKLTMSAKSNFNNPGVDFVLMLDMSKYMDSNSVTSLKTAVINYIKKISDLSDNSRIAIVQYSEEAKVLSGTQKPKDGALVTVKDNVKNLETIVENIDSTGSGNSNCDKAMLKTVQIFQDANKNTKADGNINGGTYATRTRVSVLFTAGIPGAGKNDKDSSGWSYDARERAQAAMSLSVILNADDRNNDAVLDDEAGVAGGTKWGQMENNYIGNGLASKQGCGSTVYIVGLGLPNSLNPANINSSDDSKKIDKTDIAEQDNSGTWNLKISSKQSALVNEYLYRVSSHRKDGLHYNLSSDENKKMLEKNDKIFEDEFNKLSNDIKNLYGNKEMNFYYPDDLTRNRKDSYVDGSYFLTTNDASQLDDLFNKIADQAGENFKNLKVKDYIDSSFVPVKSDGSYYSETELTNGVAISSSNGEGKLYYSDEDGYYVIWSKVELTHESSKDKGDGKSFNESIYVKPVNGFIGGNNLTTNTSSSGIYKEDDSYYAFPQPTVDIPINYSIERNDQNIYLTNSVDLADLISNKPDGITNKGVRVTYTFKKGDFVRTLTYKAGNNQGIWSDDFSGIVGFDDGLTGDQEYEISCTIESINKSEDKLIESTSHHVHADVADKATDYKNANINVFTPTLKYKDLDAYYEDSIPTYDDARVKDSITWTHGSGDSMISDTSDNGGISEKYKTSKPDLSKSDCYSYSDGFDYTKDTTLEGKVPVKSDYRVGVTVSVNDKNITDFTSFEHVNCNDDEVMFEKNPIIVHVRTCSLTINKINGKDGETYVFTIKKDGNDYTKASITVVSNGTGSVTISELPVGTYSVEENSDLGWRYKPTYTVNNVTTSEIELPVKDAKGIVVSNDGAVSCNNSNRNDQWLNKISSVVKNEFGKSHSKVISN